jgi:hypothetical protein
MPSRAARRKPCTNEKDGHAAAPLNIHNMKLRPPRPLSFSHCGDARTGQLPLRRKAEPSAEPERQTQRRRLKTCKPAYFDRRNPNYQK